MKIGIIGSGNVGGALGVRFSQTGHTVTFASRNPQSDEMAKLVAKAGNLACAASLDETVAGNEILLLATPWPATKPILEGLPSLAGKTLIDATNPLLPNLQGMELGTTTSGAEEVAKWAAGAHVVKAFNTVGFNIMENPAFGEAKALLLYCGDDTAAKSSARQLANDIGFDAVDAGPLTQARLLEPLALLWISLAFQQKMGREFAFQFLRR